MIHWLKGATKSLTIWFNSVAAALILYLPEFQTSMPQLAAYLPPDAYKWLALTVVASNMLLRAKTNSALSEKGK